MDLNVGRYSSTRQRWQNERRTMEELVTTLIEEDPTADRKRIVQMFDERAKQEDEWRVAAVDAAVGNTLNRINALQGRRQTSAQVLKRQKEEAKIVERGKADIVKTVWLNEIMPNGKRMRHCTGTEMLKWGGGYSAVGRKVKTKLVGEVLDEKQVRALMR